MQTSLGRLPAALSLLFLAASPSAWSDTWSDQSGKFKIEADYVGVDGRSVVLKKPDGTTIKVAVNRLSAESRARARDLYEAENANGQRSDTSAATKYVPKSRNLSFAPPEPPAIDPLPPFPRNPSLQETVDFCVDQLLAGHPEVFWYALPDSVRDELDSPKTQQKFKTVASIQAEAIKPLEEPLIKLVQVLVTKKQFVLGSRQLTQALPPEAMPLIKQAYDPGAGAIYEFVMMATDQGAMADVTISEFLDYYGPRIGAHLHQLAKFSPPGAIDRIMAQVEVKQNGDNRGTVSIPGQQGRESTAFVRVDGRWLPEAMAAMMGEDGSGLVDLLMAQSGAVDPQMMQQVQMMVGGVAAMVNTMIDPLLTAESQEQFDEEVSKIMTTVSALTGQLGGAPAF